MKKLLLFLTIFISLNSFSQNEFNYWFFGNYNGLDFTSGTPVVIGGSIMTQTEGVAAISDAGGNLLFYTNGINVYNRNNVIMPNGSGLLGDASSTQSSIIIKKPLSSSIYYIFTADVDIGPDGIRWNEVDMTLNAGLGAVTANKNILLQTPSCEKLCAVRHCNGRDIWVISHDWNSNTFRAWLVDDISVGATVVWSNAGSVVNGISQSGYGQLKASSDGTRLGTCYYGYGNSTGINKVEVYDFDKATGVVSNAITLSTTEIGPYGFEFSKTGRFVYAATNQGRLNQWDLCAPNILASKYLVQNTGPFIGSLQMANNGKIYVSRGTQPILSAINNPEVAGVGCGFVTTAVNLTSSAMFGLPNFPAYYNEPTLFPITANQTDCNTFCFSYPPPILSCNEVMPTFQWSFSDGTVQFGLNVCKTFPTNTNNEDVLLEIIQPCRIDSIFININVGSNFDTIITIN